MRFRHWGCVLQLSSGAALQSDRGRLKYESGHSSGGYTSSGRNIERCTMSLTDQAMLSRSTKNENCGAASPSSRSHEAGQLHPPRMARLTVSLPSDLVDRLRDAVYWSPSLTLAWLIAQSLRTTLTQMESLRQSPFPKRTRALRAGRPRLVGQSMNVSPRARITSNGTACQAKGGIQATLIS